MDQQTHMVDMVKLMMKNVPWFAPMILIISVEMIGEIVSMILLLIQSLGYVEERCKKTVLTRVAMIQEINVNPHV